jgi:GNAT superfamily N-acetyltransferase
MINLPLLNLPDIDWRPIRDNDLATLGELARACHLRDGGLGWMFEPDSLQSNYFPGVPGVAIGAFSSDGGMVACASVHIDSASDNQRVIIFGQVHPDYRNKGFGNYLIRWSQAQGQNLLAGNHAEKRVFQIKTESLTDPADRLYRAYGFDNVFEELVMQRDLCLPVPVIALPNDVVISSWKPELAEQFYQAYYAAFQNRPKTIISPNGHSSRLGRGYQQVLL